MPQPTITMTVPINEQPVDFAERHQTGLTVKRTAIAAGVAIQEDFILVEEIGHGRSRVVGDDDVVHLTPASRFTANDGDEDS